MNAVKAGEGGGNTPIVAETLNRGARAHLSMGARRVVMKTLASDADARQRLG